jgi:hypothetical protein
MSNSNRAITLVGANRIFGAIDLEIVQSPLGFYESKGSIVLQAQTLTELCQNIIKSLAEGAKS